MRTEIVLVILPVVFFIAGYVLGRYSDRFEWMNGVGDDEYEI